MIVVHIVHIIPRRKGLIPQHANFQLVTLKDNQEQHTGRTQVSGRINVTIWYRSPKQSLKMEVLYLAGTEMQC